MGAESIFLWYKMFTVYYKVLQNLQKTLAKKGFCMYKGTKGRLKKGKAIPYSRSFLEKYNKRESKQ